ncbi:hypothetical protein L1987_18585 [Smallanthus sonchifolius]|uniref:Uncharacterized protein n=1 Tax=Smallanthus sonchifolius TaxID=185202 RepID=A0ACB9J250_9ASTR|nr:hypothetical protein L1987_18585 [Smallanthus sonchifolius]
MEEKVANAMNLVQKDGDSFAKRAEMYYKHRPELIAFIEESVRAYRALAERYDKLSTDLQKANTTIATVFPDQLPYDTDYEDDDNNDNNRPKMTKNIGPAPDPPKAPKVPETIKTFLTNGPKKSPVKKTTKADNHSNGFMKSGLTKEEAVEEIDKLQKDILSMQTVKEFTKSSYESGLAKFSKIENKIIEMQQRVCDLEDEFKVVKWIEDDDAHAIMAEAALKSCEESLAKLQAKHEKSSQEARLEHARVQNAKQRLESFKHEYLQFRDHDDDDDNDEHKHEKDSRNTNESEENELQAKIKVTLEGLSNKPLTVTEMADKIDKLVNTVISLETLVSSQSTLIDRTYLAKTFKDMEKKLDGVQELEMNIENQNNSLKMHFTEAHCNVHHLFENICNMNEDFKLSEPSINGGEIKLTTKRVEEKQINFTNDDDHVLKPKKQDEEATNETNWKELLLGGLDDKEKVLLQEYTTILRKYKTAKKEIADEEQKNQEIVGEMKTQLLDLKTLSTFHQVQKFKTEVEDLQQEIVKVKAKQSDGKSSIRSEINAIFKHLKEIQTELTIWIDQSTLLKNELQRRFSSLFDIQEDIKRALREGVEEDEIKFNTHQAAKFQGEVSNMQQENTKVNQELEAGLNHVTALQVETEKTLKQLEDEFSLSDQKQPQSPNRPHVPLRSFIFGVKSKKQKPSILACINPHKRLTASNSRIM